MLFCVEVHPRFCVPVSLINHSHNHIPYLAQILSNLIPSIFKRNSSIIVLTNHSALMALIPLRQCADYLSRFPDQGVAVVLRVSLALGQNLNAGYDW